MISIMLKLIPLGVFAGGAMQGTEKIEPLLEYVRTVVVQFEVHNITKCIKLDAIDGDQLPSQSNLAEYIRKNFDVKEEASGSRDQTKDYWGTPYYVFYKNQQVSVMSAGPDKKLGTPDDIISREKL